MMEKFREAIASGEINPTSAIIVFTDPNPDGSLDIRTWRSNMSWPEEYAYLGIAQKSAVNYK